MNSRGYFTPGDMGSQAGAFLNFIFVNPWSSSARGERKWTHHSPWPSPSSDGERESVCGQHEQVASVDVHGQRVADAANLNWVLFHRLDGRTGRELQLVLLGVAEVTDLRDSRPQRVARVGSDPDGFRPEPEPNLPANVEFRTVQRPELAAFTCQNQ